MWQILWVAFGLVSVHTDAQIFSNVFGSNMVLQRDVGANLYGILPWSQPDELVTVVVSNGMKVSTMVDADTGYWVAQLPPIAGSLETYTLSASTTTGLSQTLENVLFGDVFICGGQSNMQFTVSMAFNSTAEIQAANNYPYIRVFTVGMGNSSSTPLPVLASVLETWSVANNVTVGGPAFPNFFLFFSAVCWFFGRDTFDGVLGGQIPVGLIGDNWGGTIIQAWSPPSVMEICNDTSHMQPTRQQPLPSVIHHIRNDEFISEPLTPSTTPTTTTTSSPPLVDEFARPKLLPTHNTVGDNVDPNTPSALWNAMIVPYANFTLKAAIWYQGEANTDGDGGPELYPCLFSHMVAAWRQSFRNPKMPFMFVQLAPWNNTATGGPQFALSQMRVAQQIAQTLTPFSGFATAVDLGDYDSPWSCIHPRDKQDVGTRLANVARNLVYGQSVQAIGPTFTSAKVVTNAATPTIRLNMLANSTGTGLQLVDNAAENCPSNLGDYANECGYPLMLLTDGNWYNVSIVLVPGQNYVEFVVSPDSRIFRRGTKSSPEESVHPSKLGAAGVEYAYADYPICSIYNSAMLPALPYRWVAQDFEEYQEQQ